ncbi:S66 peptidase family protein [Bacillus manliponensis]
MLQLFFQNIQKEVGIMFPAKLKQGDEIRIVSPSSSLGIVSEENKALATKKLKEMGFYVTFSTHAEEIDRFFSSSIQSRVQDLHDAFADPNVKAIITTLGGYNANQLLHHLDYELIRHNPKILCGYSDITALSNAIYAKTGVITYSGPFFSSFAMEKGIAYTIDYFQKCFMSEKPFSITPSATWSDDSWHREQENRNFFSNEGYIVIQQGEATGTIVGGNMSTLHLLQGTAYMPNLQDCILFLEEDDLTGNATLKVFDRYLQSLVQQPNFEHVRGIIIGKFQRGAHISIEDLRDIIATKKELSHLPIIANANFGHTTPIFTFPIGGKASLLASAKHTKLTILEH